MAKSVMDLVAEAKSMVPSISPAELEGLLGRDDLLVVDVRDPPEVASTGKVQGALNVSRGMLEFRADETTPYHDKAFRKDKTIVLYCASGGRSALGGKALLELGYRDVRNLGAFKDWVEAGGPIETP
ncbi:MAG TPA: rhodanese-like domain-containing protein [Thermohalobaculum sp.]|nr:rhodanese-like domain-containing protein [Thermohalobaculum sp.]